MDANLGEFIERVECLNEDASNPAVNILDRSDSYLASLDDEQLLITLRFRQPVKISGLRLQGVEEGSAPAVVRLFANSLDMDFGDAEDKASTQDFTLTAKQCNIGAAKDEILAVKYVKFQCVTSLTLFVASNLGEEDVTKLRGLQIFGNAGEKSNIADWKPCKS